MNIDEMTKYLLGRGYDPYYIKEAISESQNPNNNNYIYNMMMSNYGESNPKTALYNIYDLEFGNPEGVSRPYPSSQHQIIQDYFNKIFNNPTKPSFSFPNEDFDISRDYLTTIPENLGFTTGPINPNDFSSSFLDYAKQRSANELLEIYKDPSLTTLYEYLRNKNGLPLPPDIIRNINK